MQDNKAERFPIVDEEGRVIGAATRGECHNGSRLLHPVVHLHVFNSQGEVYLQKRPAWKDIQPGKWDTSVGGHLDYGETPEQALVREVREELGITDFEPERVGQYVFDSRRERELVYVNRTTYDAPSVPLPKNSMAAVSGRSTRYAPPSANRSSPRTSKANSSGSSCKNQRTYGNP